MGGFPTPKKGFWNPDLRDPEQLGPAINLAVTTALCALPTVPLPCIAILTSHRHGETAPAPRGASGGLAGWVKSELWEKHPVGEKLGQGPQAKKMARDSAWRCKGLLESLRRNLRVGGSQGRGQIGAEAKSFCHQHCPHSRVW